MESTENPVGRILEQQVIPLIAENGAERMIVARSSYKEFGRKANLPFGMRLTRWPLRSHREKVRGKHYYGKQALVNAPWTKDGLHSLRTSKLAIVLEGEITFQCGDALLHCMPGHVIFIPPDVPHPDGSRTYLEETAFLRGSCKLLFIGIHAEGIAV